MNRIVFFLFIFLLQTAKAQEDGISQEPTQPLTPTPTTENTIVKEWTMLVFLNGHNNLDYFGNYNINQMEQVGSTDQINIVVQQASLEKDTKRFYITKGIDPDKVESTEVESLPRVDMGDYKKFVEFVLWGAKKYPAKKYFVVIWNHGSGWHTLSEDLEMNFQSLAVDISNDDYSNNKITTLELGYAFKEIESVLGKKIELYGSDACLMQMLEVATEIKSGVNYIVGSQELEPGEGWPYHLFLKRWAEKPEMNGGELGKILSEEYLNQYPDFFSNPSGTTMSILDLKYVDTLNQQLFLLKEELKAVVEKDILYGLADTTQSFYYSDYKDLKHFLEQLASSSLSLNSQLLTDLQTTLKQLILHNVKSENRQNANGLSVWIPTYNFHYNIYIDLYKDLSFEKETAWSSFVETLMVYGRK